MNNNILSVTELNQYIKSFFDTSPYLQDVYIKGEISNFTNHYKTGHFYFTLKDEGGVLKSVMFRSSVSTLKFLPENGMKVVAHGRISLYVKDGSYQLYVDSMEPDGVGALYIAFEQLKAKLEAEGLFSSQYKKPIPKYPAKIGIVTSPTGAAIRDMINVSKRRFPLAEIILFPCLVQGDNAPSQICKGIIYFNTKLPVDTIIIGRGGGSLEELWAFNNEDLARTIFASKIPIISAVGHETDFSISDFVSDLRAPTPSAAAELALPDYRSEQENIFSKHNKISVLLNNKFSNLHTKIDSISMKKCLTSPKNFIDDKRITLDNLSTKLDDKVKVLLDKKGLSMSAVVSKLDALNPLKVISRGYSAVFKEDGKLVKSIDDVKVGDNIDFTTVGGSVSAVVEKIVKKGE
ncbi:MAG: exodeoxyribonuclease VII large subunit [Ruminococcaceae bacterium]|nr:exodeoxyribonuclease VII large subunit [Oscillospiraceae bacterium]